MAALLATLAAGCDIAKPTPEPGEGPSLHLIASYPADGQGTNAAPDADLNCTSPTPDCPVPTNVSVELRFDRFLLPGSGITLGTALYSGNPPANGSRLTVEYDLIERVVVLRPSKPLIPRTLYTVEILQFSDPSQGFWAYDRAPLEEALVPLRFSFTTGSGPATVPAAPTRVADTCETIAEGALASCSKCHSTTPADGDIAASYPPMGLDLSSAPGLFYTAVSHAAHQTETGNTIGGQGLQTPARFGVQMNIIDPGNPATSYLMYKLLQKPENFRLGPDEASCDIPYHSPVLEGGCTPPDADELGRLRDWFVRGDPMPKNGLANGQVVNAALDHATLQRIVRWLTDGAACPEPPASAR